MTHGVACHRWSGTGCGTCAVHSASARLHMRTRQFNTQLLPSSRSTLRPYRQGRQKKP